MYVCMCMYIYIYIYTYKDIFNTSQETQAQAALFTEPKLEGARGMSALYRDHLRTTPTRLQTPERVLRNGLRLGSN